MEKNKALLKERKARNWSQGDVARMICINVRTYRRWEQENKLPHFESIRKLCDLFERTPEQLGFHLYSAMDDIQEEKQH